MNKSKSFISKPLARFGIFIVVVAMLSYVLIEIPMPYMINSPGTAEEIKPMISVEGGDQQEQGAFMLTTVSVSYANMMMLMLSYLNPHAEIVPKEPDRDRQQYEVQQRYYMSNSQSNAIMAAYDKAGVEYQILPQYVFIVGLSKDVKTKGDFAAGDVIKKVNGTEVKGFEALTNVLHGKKAGDVVSVELEREGKPIEQQVELVPIPDKENKDRAGLGVSVGEVQDVVPNNDKEEVKFVNTRIGGPSAGLMFTLEIYNQLTPGDLSKGHRIAGTGTITKEGEVGSIGGVQFKIVAADKEGAEIFFVPKDNYEVAKAKADSIKTNMKIVSVKTLDDALNYLDKLEPVSK
jgi:PDZ domain-containing protein